MKRLIASTVLASTILFPILTGAEEINIPEKLTTSERVEIYKGATENYPVVSSISSGLNVTVIEKFTNSLGELWYRVELGSIKGWAKAEQFSPTDTSNKLQVGQGASISTTTVDMRRGASLSYVMVMTLSKGTTVKVIDSIRNSLNQEWYRIDYQGVIGWVEASSLTNTVLPLSAGNLAPTNGSYVYSEVNGAEVRRGASESYSVTTKLSYNQKVQVIDLFTALNGQLWVKVQVNSSTSGWIKAETLSQTATLNLKLYVSVDTANMRSGPSIIDEVIETSPKCTELLASYQQTDEDGSMWYKVVTPANVTAWVHESVVSKQQIVNSTNLYVATRNTKLYSGASFNYSVNQKLSFQSKITVLREFKNSLGQTWLNVKTASGITGWVPKQELVSSLNQIKYVYAMTKATVRRGASTNYAISTYLKENEEILVLNEVNGWLNVETASGVRGWTNKTQTSNVSLKRLISPTASVINGEEYLSWMKPLNLNLKYTTLSGNRLRLTGELTDVEITSLSVPGITKIAKVNIGTNEKAVEITFAPGYTFTIRDYIDRVSIKVIPFGLSGKKILVDAGHGGKDTGAIGPTGLREKDAVLGTALLLKQELENYGAIVTLTRSSDIFLELSNRTAIANSSDYDVFISVHANSSTSSSAKGTETYYNTTVNFNGIKSAAMAGDIQKNLAASLNIYDRGVKEQEFYVNRMNELPSILVELAFISNKTEESLLRSNEFRQRAASGIRKGLEEYFGNF